MKIDQEDNQKQADGIRCRTNIQAGRLAEDFRNELSPPKVKETLKDFATFPFSIMNKCNCDT